MIFGAQAKEDAAGSGKDEEASGDGDESEQDIQPKDFVWDQFLKYLATAIAVCAHEINSHEINFSKSIAHES